MAARGDGQLGSGISARVEAADAHARSPRRQIERANRCVARGDSDRGESDSPPPFRKEPRFEDLAAKVDDMGAEINARLSPRKEVEVGPLTNLVGTDKSTQKWLMQYHKRLGAPEATLEKAVCQKKGTTRETRSSGPATLDNLFRLKELPKAVPKARERFKPKPKPISSMKGPMMGYRMFGMSNSDIMKDIAEMQTKPRYSTEARVAVGATVTSRQGNSYTDRRSTGMGASAFVGGGGGGGGGGGHSHDAQNSVEAGAPGKKRKHHEAWPVSSPTGIYLHTDSNSRVGITARAGEGDGADEEELSLPIKRARVSGGTSRGNSDDGVTDGADGSVSEESFSNTEGASGAGDMACDEMSAKQSWQDGGDEDGARGGWGKDGSEGGSLDGGRVTTKGSSDWHAQDSAS